MEVVLDLGAMPLANGLLTASELGLPEVRYPLALAFCHRCCLVQITESVPPDTLFREYPYFSSVSDAMVDHARQIAVRMVAQRHLGSKSLVIELASNDGYLLRHYTARGIPVLGIEPARNIAAAAAADGIPTLPEFFGSELATDLKRDGRLADVVHANNVIAHVPDIHGFIEGISMILKPEGVAVIETPYVRDLVEGLEFDTIYHEHLFYYSLTSLGRILDLHGLAVADVERIAIHGGSLRIFVMQKEAARTTFAASSLLSEEAAIGIGTVDYFKQFAARVSAVGEELHRVLAEGKQAGGTVAAYGAAAKGAVLLNAFKIGTDTIDFVADRSPHKQGRFMPGVHIPIMPPEYLVETMPEWCLLLAWNFAGEIRKQQAEYLNRGGRFIVPVPWPTIVGT